MRFEEHNIINLRSLRQCKSSRELYYYFSGKILLYSSQAAGVILLTLGISCTHTINKLCNYLYSYNIIKIVLFICIRGLLIEG